MSNLILLIHDQTDLNALPNAAKSLIDHGYKGVWVLVSPAIAADQAAAAAQLDQEIADLLKAEKTAAERADYVAAGEHKLARQGKELERGTALANAWKAVPDDQRQMAYKSKLEPLLSTLRERKLNMKVDVLQDHYDREQWLTALQGLAGTWFKPMVPGGFSVAWPGAIPEKPSWSKIASELPTPPVKPEVTKEQKEEYERQAKATQKPAPQTREQELMGLRTFALYAAAKAAGVDHKGKKQSEIVAAIIAAETKAPEAVEAY